MLVMPAELEWIIKRDLADPTSGSLRETDATSGSLIYAFNQRLLAGNNVNFGKGSELLAANLAFCHELDPLCRYRAGKPNDPLHSTGVPRTLGRLLHPSFCRPD
jgi:hypothetical protein